MLTETQARSHMTLSDLRAMQEEFKAKTQASALPLIVEAAMFALEAYPEMAGVTWTQFTPYFNDGEESVFGVSEPSFVNSDGDEVAPWDIGTKKERERMENALAPVRQFDEEVMGYAFGKSDLRITVMRDGTIETEEYDSHD